MKLYCTRCGHVLLPNGECPFCGTKHIIKDNQIKNDDKDEYDDYDHGIDEDAIEEYIEDYDDDYFDEDDE